MPVKDCIWYNGRIYCWNAEERVVDEYTINKRPLNECPETVIFDLMKLVYTGSASENNDKKSKSG